RDCVGVMPTGAGKSLTYQIPARVLGGTTLVVSPLVALMKDQVDAVTEVGLRATFLNSTLDLEERRRRVQGLAAGEYELCYAAPEGIEASVGHVLGRLDLRLIAGEDADVAAKRAPRVRDGILRLVRARAGQSGIVYCLSRKSTESTAAFLREHGVRAAVYHAGLDASARNEAQESFRRDRVDVVVA